MPVGIQAVMKWLPFYYELFCPIAIFLGRLQGPALAEALAIQTGWLLLAWAWANAMWRAASATTDKFDGLTAMSVFRLGRRKTPR